ncbi:MAG: prolyl oligopeptidase family serine peptidase [Akkermansiaceae bacterium]|nr:prolyl oligopeptidase family serine peptidase [Armatimonadota bacterium]
MFTRFTSYLPAVLPGVLFLALLPLARCHAELTAPKASPRTEILAGVTYDPSAPLAAVTKPIFDAKNPPTEARTFRVTYKGAANAVVPALLTVPGSGRTRSRQYPAVVLIHGLSSRKEDTLLLAVAFARRGYATLSIDLPVHGERRLRDGRTIADLTLEETRRVGGESVADLRRGVDYLSTRSDIDVSRLGCVGISLGGIFGGVFAGVEKRIKSVVLWSAGGDWGELLTQSRHPFALKRREKGSLPDAETVEKTLRDIDPLTYIANLTPRPLLLLAGTNDYVVPNECTDVLFEAAKEPKKLVRYPGGHIPDLRAMTVRTLDFFDGTLRRGK